MDADDLRAWFDDYLEAFAASARRETDTRPLLAFYGVPLTVTTDAGAITMTTEDQVASTVQGQVDALHAEGYDTTVVMGFVVTPINASSALLSTALSRRAADGAELNVVAMTYLVTEGPRRIAVMAVHAGS
jgi:hypothetical protein